MSLAALEQLLATRQRLHAELVEFQRQASSDRDFETTVNRLETDLDAIDRKFPIMTEELVVQRVEIPWATLWTLGDSVLRHLSRRDESASRRLRAALKIAAQHKIDEGKID